MTEEYLVLFNFQSYSFRAEKILQDLGITADFIPTPRKYEELCANSLRVRGIEQAKLQQILDEHGVVYAGIHPYTPSKLLKDFTMPQEDDSLLLREVRQKVREDLPLKREEITFLFQLTNPRELEVFWQLAGQVRDNNLGKAIELWGLIKWQESLEDAAVLSLAIQAANQGIKYLFLELADLEGFSLARFLELAAKIRESTPLKLVVSGNSNLFLHFASLQKAGLSYILKHVTLEERQAFLDNPQEILEEILFLWYGGKSNLFGVSPLLPMPYQIEKQSPLLGRKITALLRILFKDAFIPAFNCVSSLDLEEQLRHLEVGANVLLLDFTLEAQKGAAMVSKYE